MKKSNIIWVEGHFERTDEKKDELKNRISLALKDPILQQGFECICKENADLKIYNAKLLNGDIEKHNNIVELETELAKRAEQIEALNKDKDYFSDALDKQIEATYKVVEENNELKEQVSYLKDNLRVARKDREDLQLDVAKGLKEFVKDYPETAFRYLANEKYVEKFNKAKEIIKGLLELGSIGDGDYTYVAEAEQFLEED